MAFSFQFAVISLQLAVINGYQMPTACFIFIQFVVTIWRWAVGSHA